MSKICRRCGEGGTFRKDTRNKDGLVGVCTKCENNRRSERYHSIPSVKQRVKQLSKKYNNEALKRAKQAIVDLPDHYIIKELRRGSDLTVEDIKAVPDLIELKRQIILNKRLCRSKTLRN